MEARSAGDSSLLRQFYRSTCGICCSWIGVDERIMPELADPSDSSDESEDESSDGSCSSGGSTSDLSSSSNDYESAS